MPLLPLPPWTIFNDQPDVVEIYCRRLVAWVLVCSLFVAWLCTTTSFVSPCGKVLLSSDLVLAVFPSWHVLLLTAALSLVIFTLSALLFADLEIFVTPRSLWNTLWRRARLAGWATVLGVAVGLILHRLLEVRWAASYGNDGGIVRNVIASLRLLALQPNVVAPGAAVNDAALPAIQRFALQLNAAIAQRARLADKLANHINDRIASALQLGPDDFYRSPFGMVLCVCCGVGSLLAMARAYDRSRLRCLALQWEPEAYIEGALETAQALRDVVVAYISLLLCGAESKQQRREALHVARADLRRLLAPSPLPGLATSALVVLAGSLSLCVLGRVLHFHLAHLPMHQQPLLIVPNALLALSSYAETGVLSIYTAARSSLARAYVRTDRPWWGSRSANDVSYVSPDGQSCSPRESAPAPVSSRDEYKALIAVLFAMSRGLVLVACRVACALCSLLFNHTYPLSLWVSLWQAAIVVAIGHAAPLFCYILMLSFLRAPVRFFRLRECGSTGLLARLAGFKGRGEDAVLAAISCRGVYPRAAPKGWWSGAALVRGGYTAREEAVRAQEGHAKKMMQDCAPERVGPACSPLLGGPALQGAHNLAGIVRAHALQDLVSTLEGGEEEDPEVGQEERRRLFGGAGAEGRWGQVCVQLLSLLDAASLQLMLMQAHLVTDVMAGQGPSPPRVANAIPPAPPAPAAAAAVAAGAGAGGVLGLGGLRAGGVAAPNIMLKPLPAAPPVAAAVAERAWGSVEEVAAEGRKRRLETSLGPLTGLARWLYAKYGKPAPSSRSPGLSALLDAPLLRLGGRAASGLQVSGEYLCLPALAVQSCVLACAALASGLERALRDDLGGTASYLVPSAAVSLLSLAGNIADAKAAWERARGVALAAVPRVRRAGRALLDAAERCGDAGALGRLDLLSDAAEDALAVLISCYRDVLERDCSFPPPLARALQARL